MGGGGRQGAAGPANKHTGETSGHLGIYRCLLQPKVKVVCCFCTLQLLLLLLLVLLDLWLPHRHA
jgi:hypothetical protein